MPEPSEGQPHRARVEVALRAQGYDIDLAGIVSNIVFVRWLEDLRLAICDAYYPVSEMLAQGFVPVLASTHVDYKRAIRFGDAVAGRVWFEGFKGLRWTFGFEITVNGATSATATQTGVLLRLADNRPIRVPQDMVERFNPPA